MNFAHNKEKSTKYPIEYVCNDCSFTTQCDCVESQINQGLDVFDRRDK